MNPDLAIHPLKNWIPYKVVLENDVILIHWLFVSDHFFSAPFFDETIGRCKSHPYNSTGYRSVSSPESMIEWARTFPERIPSAFIFHISRCGSTLLSQLIGSDKKYLVLSEVPFFDEILRLPYRLKGVDPELTEKMLHAGIKIVGQNRSGLEHNLFIKTDSWHIFFHEQIRRLYPFSPFILLYRSPDAVIRSHKKLQGIHTVQGQIEPDVFGFTGQEIEGLLPDMYTSKVLEKYLSAFEDVMEKDKQTLLLDYKYGAMKMMAMISDHLKINWEENHLKEMERRSKFHSKRPNDNFTEEPEEKEFPEYIHHTMMAYSRLNKKAEDNGTIHLRTN